MAKKPAFTPVIKEAHVTVYQGDCIEVLRSLPDNSIDAVVTDPPYGLEFRGNDWDAPWKEGEPAPKGPGDVIHDPATVGGFQDGAGGNPYSRSRIRYGIGVGFQDWVEEWATECLRVLKPGGHMVAFGGSRMVHRLASGIEDAGFEIRDSMAWLYSQGFPKSHNISLAIDRELGAKREVIGKHPNPAKNGKNATASIGGGWNDTDEVFLSAPATDQSKKWDGWGTALKPAYEPIIVGRKPLEGTVAGNVLAYGTGGMNIDATRIDGEPYKINTFDNGAKPFGDAVGEAYSSREGSGRWPTNVVMDDETAAVLDEQAGNVSRFYPVFKYQPKASVKERPKAVSESGETLAHPTVKPLELMRWLVRLFTPEGGVVLDPFLGSGTTAEAALVEGFDCVGIEREPKYVMLIQQRLEKSVQSSLF